MFSKLDVESPSKQILGPHTKAKARGQKIYSSCLWLQRLEAFVTKKHYMSHH